MTTPPAQPAIPVLATAPAVAVAPSPFGAAGAALSGDLPPFDIITPRLRLRLPSLDDAPAIFDAYAQDAAVTRYLAWTPHRSIEETQAFLTAQLACWDRRIIFGYVITRRQADADAADRPIGMIGLRPCTAGLEVGYVLARDHWGQGYGTEALERLAGWALTLPTVWRVWAVCHVDHAASARVMVKAGLSAEGVLRRWAVFPNLGPEPQDCRIFARVR